MQGAIEGAIEYLHSITKNRAYRTTDPKGLGNVS